MSVLSLAAPPNFRVSSGEPGLVKLQWADYPINVKEGHRLIGFRIYRSTVKDELGQLIADERLLDANVFQFDDTDPEAGSDRYYVIVAVEEGGTEAPFGASPYGSPNTNGFSFPPYSQRPFGSPLRGYGQAPFGIEAYGF